MTWTSSSPCRKPTREGNFSPVVYLGNPHPGAIGILRVSHRELDAEASTPFAPVQTHAHEQLLSPGEIVPVEIAVWPSSRVCYPGERLRLVISGHRTPSWFLPFAWEVRNQGRHTLHTGGQFDSHLLVPVVPRRKYASKPADVSGIFGPVGE
ncbi:CocE/NonD family hydrolase C-terminal non-catalytic domain-containing protein [Leifsonia sp. McL0607]|uniref:CocE/NonD family hydrolase C-terminal non-catalytic domain-containing protein n=1 Tax=Leifsonia sp. McL0607 TaxID=3415672 RepID=UPI003CF324CE